MWIIIVIPFALTKQPVELWMVFLKFGIACHRAGSYYIRWIYWLVMRFVSALFVCPLQHAVSFVCHICCNNREYRSFNPILKSSWALGTRNFVASPAYKGPVMLPDYRQIVGVSQDQGYLDFACQLS